MQIILPEELNTYDVLVSDWLVFTQATLDTTIARLGATTGASDDATSVTIGGVPTDEAEDTSGSDDAADEGADE